MSSTNSPSNGESSATVDPAIENAATNSAAPTVAAPRLRSQLCFELYSASKASTAVYRPMLEKLDLSYPQYLVMMVLWEKSPLTVREIGDELGLDSGTLSPLLKRLEAAGRVERIRDAEDERRVQIHLTDAGRALSTQACSVPASLFAAAGLSEAEVQQLHSTLVKLNTSLQASLSATAS
ncbi:MarR family winged helix-turn-helix transcriptional regulator [Pseudarthrobacter sp. J1738]|uniref:MarR family winged helix-turn-helix transcriptional regulator n=1 Tax=unclassified Pseudarthrobacter TaxID=2647000 RepID=UPI003D26F1A4